ncbi:uncharacterized protein LOC135823966 [Sycon ciliatum]|uniref:uncharacterized protein LOC135823966 n=1 Tax=Sycon ciliatum TaxID=27933 RepID=UPI0020AB7D11|eukprot:scpid54083/ scgid25655/ 
MGQCVSKAGSEQQRGNTRKSSFQAGPEMTVGPDGVEVPVDNRPVLQQQPRRKSVEGSTLPPAPHREILDPRKQAVAVTSSQLEFFKMLDEKIEKGVVPEDEEDGEGDASAGANCHQQGVLSEEAQRTENDNVDVSASQANAEVAAENGTATAAVTRNGDGEEAEAKAPESAAEAS